MVANGTIRLLAAEEASSFDPFRLAICLWEKRHSMGRDQGYLLRTMQPGLWFVVVLAFIVVDEPRTPDYPQSLDGPHWCTDCFSSKCDEYPRASYSEIQ